MENLDTVDLKGFSQRLKLLRERGPHSDSREFSLAIGSSVGALSGYENGKNWPNGKVFAAIQNLTGVDLNWLVAGIGAPFDDQAMNDWATELSRQGTKEQSKNQYQVDVHTLFAYLQKYEVRASAGSGALALNENTVGQIAIEKSFLSQVGLDPENAGVVVASGDSMSPTIYDGTPMVVDFSQMDPISGRIYVFSIGGELVVKRLERTIDGQIDLISDNPVYEKRTIDLNRYQDMMIVGRVRFILKDM